MDEFDEIIAGDLTVACDGCEEPAAIYRPKTDSFWCEVCRKQLALLHIEV